MDEKVKKLEELLASEEFINDFTENLIKERDFIERYINKLKDMSLNDRLNFYDKVYKKYNSKEYTNKEYYVMGREPMCSLYNVIFEYAMKYMPNLYGTNIFVVDNKWTIELIHGQGSYINFKPFDKSKCTIYDLINFDIVSLNDLSSFSLTFDDNNLWRHYELTDGFGLVAYEETYECKNKLKKRILIHELSEDDGYWCIRNSHKNQGLKWDSVWIESRINVFERMKNFLKQKDESK